MSAGLLYFGLSLIYSVSGSHFPESVRSPPRLIALQDSRAGREVFLMQIKSRRKLFKDKFFQVVEVFFNL